MNNQNLSSSEIDIILEQLTNVKIEKYEALEKIKKLNKDINNSNLKYETLENNYNNVNNEKEKATNQIKKMQDTINAMSNHQRFIELTQENESLKEQVRLLKTSMHSMFEESSKIKEELDFLRKVQNKVHVPSDVADSISAEINPNLASQYSSSIAIATQSVQIDELNSKLAEKDLIISDNIIAIKKLEDDLNSEKSQTNRILNKLSQREEELNRTNESLSDSLVINKNLNSKEQELFFQIQTITLQNLRLEEMSKQISELSNESKEKSNKIQTLEFSLASHNSSIEHVNNLNNQISHKSKEIIILNQKLIASQDQEAFWRDECETLKLSLSESAIVIRAHEEDIASLTRSKRDDLLLVESLRSCLETKEKSVSEMTETVMDYELQIRQWEARVRSLESSISSKDKELFEANEYKVINEKKLVEDAHKNEIDNLNYAIRIEQETYEEKFIIASENFESETSKLTATLSNLTLELEESKAQQRVGNKKRLQIVKELKDELKKQLMVNNELRVIIKASEDEMSPIRESTDVNNRRESIPNTDEHIVNRPTSKSASEEMTVYLTKRIAEIQEQNFSLKQKVKHLESGMQDLTNELINKKVLIAGLMRYNGITSESDIKLDLDLKLDERFLKMQDLLEETYVNYNNLKKSSDTIGKELNKVYEEKELLIVKLKTYEEVVTPND